MARASNTIIESIGVYLPPRAVSTDEVLRGCKNEIRFPLEQLTGIVSRRMAGEVEFSLDLAKKAVADCLANSQNSPHDIDLLICSNISRYDAPNRVSYEPSASMVLRKHFGFDNALVFDISNACAGMFTGIYVVDVLIKIGMIRCGMVVSGEYITHLTRTAQKEIDNYMDPQLACLTLGDAGAAIILQQSPGNEVGFHALDMYTLGKYSGLCIAKATDNEHGGATMVTDSIRATAAVVEHTAKHAAHVVRGSRRPVETFQHIIPHQTSTTSINEGLREIARLFNKNLQGMVIDNVAHRGNTASNTHFVAIKDNILKSRIKSGDNAIFCFSGSGITIGTALYTFDDLPDRLRRKGSNHDGKPNSTPSAGRKSGPLLLDRTGRVRLEAVGTTIARQPKTTADTREFVKAAAEVCLQRSSHDRKEIDLVISAGVHRSGFVAEPAAAAIAVGDLAINVDSQPQDHWRTLTFDILNGSLGFLNACYVATGMINAKRCNNIMIVVAETENNAQAPPAKRRGVKQMGSAVILDESVDGQTGFGSFLFKYFPQHIDAFTSYATGLRGATRLVFKRAADIEDRYLECIDSAVRELLDAEGLDISQIKTILPPQISSTFVSRLGELLKVDRDRIVNVACDGQDLYTSSTPCALEYACRRKIVQPGDVGLIINVAAGIQVGCATYYF